ncbi:MAG: class I SAM-dependent methyltransferase [Candidatus Aminicenantia bacterium]
MSFYIEVKAFHDIGKRCQQKRGQLSFQTILNLGCGNGQESEELANQLLCKIIGVDIEFNFIKISNKKVNFCQNNSENLSFKDESFDAVYCYHVLEHILNYHKALSEIKRILKKGGVCYIGVPNKHRLLGSLGTDRVTFWDKIKNNIIDWKYRIKGEFENEKGAHAGFVEEFLRRELEKYFSQVYSVRKDYFRIKYNRHKWLINSIIKMKLGDVLFPSNYFLCIK